MKGIKYTDAEMRVSMQAAARARRLADARAARADEKLRATPEWQAQHAAACARDRLLRAQQCVVERRIRLGIESEYIRWKTSHIRRLRERRPGESFAGHLTEHWRERRWAQADLRKAIAGLAALEPPNAEKKSA